MDRWLLSASCLIGLALGGALVLRWGRLVRRPPPRPDSRGSAALAVLRRACIGVVAGAVAGTLVGGLGGRLVMRVAAATSKDAVQGTLTEAEEEIGDVTLDGTIGLVIFVGVFIGAFGGLLYVILRRWLPGRAWPAGLVFGGGLLVVFGRLDPLDPENIDFAVLTPRWLAVLLVSVLFPLYGMVLASVAERLERGYPRLAARPGPIAAHGPLVATLLAPPLALGLLVWCGGAALFARRGPPSPRLEQAVRALLALALVVFVVWFAVGVVDILDGST